MKKRLMRNAGVMGRILGLLLMLGLSAMVAAPARAQGFNPVFQARADEVVVMLNGGGVLEDSFAPGFLSAVPAYQLRTVSSQLTAQYGRAYAARIVAMDGALSGTLEIAFDQGIGEAAMVLDPAAPHRIIGLQFNGFRQADDSFTKIADEMAALPGIAGYAVAELTPSGARAVAGHNADARFAIGSAFKLYILAELTAQVEDGKRDWDDVVRLSHKSLPSGIIQTWPKDAPLTLHSLASLMISISDNSATDTLIHTLGRETVGRRVVKGGHRVPSDMIPFLTTREAFAMKMPAADGIRPVYRTHNDAGQERMLNANQDFLMNTQIDTAALLSAPMHIDTVEWFASPNDLIRLLAHMHAMDNRAMLGILAINKGIGSSDSARWRYLGYKGGSETGVVNLTFLGQRPDGRWFAVTGSWNNTAAAVDEDQFATLMTRLLNLTVAF